MFKRFMIGFVLGIYGMYYYLHYGEEIAGSAARWGQDSASKYRGDKSHSAAREVLRDTR